MTDRRVFYEVICMSFQQASKKCPLPHLLFANFIATIAKSVGRIEDAYTGAGVESPSLDATFNPTRLFNTLLFRPDIINEATDNRRQ